MNSLKPVITVDVWSDLVCPWCWIANKRFEKALAAFGNHDSVIVRHHSFRIAPGVPAMPFQEALIKKLGGPANAELMMNQVGSAGKSEGLQYNFDTMLFGDTADALMLLTAAHQAGLGEAVSERFYRAGTTEGRSLFDRAGLIRLAAEAGMSEEAAESALHNTAFRASVEEDEASARAIGVSGVPLFLLNNKYAISGAQSSENFLSTLRLVWDEVHDEVVTPDGQMCGTEGCSI